MFVRNFERVSVSYCRTIFETFRYDCSRESKYTKRERLSSPFPVRSDSKFSKSDGYRATVFRPLFRTVRRRHRFVAVRDFRALRVSASAKLAPCVSSCYHNDRDERVFINGKRSRDGKAGRRRVKRTADKLVRDRNVPGPSASAPPVAFDRVRESNVKQRTRSENRDAITYKYICYDVGNLTRCRHEHTSRTRSRRRRSTRFRDVRDDNREARVRSSARNTNDDDSFPVRTRITPIIVSDALCVCFPR